MKGSKNVNSRVALPELIHLASVVLKVFFFIISDITP